ncbi:uncharacterized protein LOC104891638 [Beta vulgaris subsp. vulgaris]|uniref:uncharacterized protein LOC104891638 n=1 Tax=Beta vulgaris subsp. vulgaris TaxID=3555 RepID=UPI002037533E|nr:uncharacterized protein LOC104891638 [Beta vulgaris subsp. vulgaris]
MGHSATSKKSGWTWAWKYASPKSGPGLLFKWIWRFITEPKALWSRVIRERYGYDDYFTPSSLSIPIKGGLWRNLCSALLSNVISKPLVLSQVRKRIGSDSHTRFWFDLWVGDCTLKVLCPRLFLLSALPNGVVSSFGFWDGSKWEWSFEWKRSLRPRDREELLSLLSTLQRVVFDPSKQDDFIWSPHKSGVFSVKSFKNEMAKSSLVHNPLPSIGIWKGLVPLRIEIFVWFAIHGKLNTRDKLVRLGIIPADNIFCAFCGEVAEDSNHLFTHCSFSREIWSWWLGMWGTYWAFPFNLRDSFLQWRAPFGDKFFKKVWAAIFFIILWSLWKERNCRIFRGISMASIQIKELILLRVGWWIKGWDPSFSYSPKEILRNPKCLRWSGCKAMMPSPASDLKLRLWSPPPHPCLKWNVDASFQPSFNKSAIGGVLRDSSGKFRCLFSSPIPPMEINMTEIFAIHRALKISLSSSNFANHHLIVESDSANAVKWCNEKSGGPWSIHFVLNFIRNIHSMGIQVTICHRGRASNCVADGLAKQGLTRSDDFIAWL